MFENLQTCLRVRKLFGVVEALCLKTRNACMWIIAQQCPDGFAGADQFGRAYSISVSCCWRERIATELLDRAPTLRLRSWGRRWWRGRVGLLRLVQIGLRLKLGKKLLVW